MISSLKGVDQKVPPKMDSELQDLNSRLTKLKGLIQNNHNKLAVEREKVLRNGAMYDLNKSIIVYRGSLERLLVQILDRCKLLNESEKLTEKGLEFYQAVQKEVDLKVEGKKRDRRIITDPQVVESKLDKALQRAKEQLEKETGKGALFLYDLRPPEASYGSLETKLEEIENCPVGIAHEKGARDSQEDESIATSFILQKEDGLEEPVMLTGVLDGHRGIQAAEFIKIRLPELLKQNLQALLDGTLGGDLEVFNSEKKLTDVAIWNLLKITCVDLSSECKQRKILSGTTGSFSLLLQGDLWTVNVGDSRTVLVSGEQTVNLSEDATLEFLFPSLFNEEEFDARAGFFPQQGYYEKSIWKRNGYVENLGSGLRINGTLAIARAFGDTDVQGVSSRPKITKVSLPKFLKAGEKLFLVHACDGLWGDATSQEVARIVNDHKDVPLDQIASHLTYSAVKAGSADNVSVVIVDLSSVKDLL